MTYDLDISFLQRLRLVTQMLEANFAHALKTVTFRQFIVLMAISSSNNPSQTDLVERTGVDRSTMADIMRRLSTRGMISRRRRRSDARTYTIQLTTRGFEVLALGCVAAAQIEAASLEPINIDERRLLMSLLDRLHGPSRLTQTPTVP